MVFSDHVAKLAHKVKWRELIGDSTTRDSPEEAEEAEEADEPSESTKPKRPEQVGPWEVVAKRLHESLTEVNVLLDVIRMGRSSSYLSLDSVFEAEREEKEAEARLKSSGHGQTVDPEFKKQAIVSKRKSLSCASSVIVKLWDRIRGKESLGDGVAIEGGPNPAAQTDHFLAELKDMRQRWRLKKLGNLILGDLGYQPKGVRYRPQATFEVTRRSGPPLRGQPCLQVSLPRQLRKSLHIRVYIGFDNQRGDGQETPQLSEPQPATPEEQQRQQQPQSGHWEQTLTAAQQTLLSRELLAALGREAVELERRIAVVQSDWLAVSIGAGFLLRVHLCHPDSVDPPGRGERMRVLENNLQRLYLASLRTELVEIPRPVSLPLHMARPSGQRRGREPGPRALAVDESERETGLLSRLVSQSEHLLLVRRTLAVLSRWKEGVEEPRLLWSWAEAGATFSVLKVQLATPGADFLPKSCFFLELGGGGVDVVAGAGETIHLGLDLDNLHDILWIQARTHQLAEIAALVRGGGGDWKILYSTSASASPHGTLLPTILLSHQNGHTALAVRLPARSSPELFLQQNSGQPLEIQTAGDLEWSQVSQAFRPINYKRLIGPTLIHKLHILLAALTNSAPDKPSTSSASAHE